MISFHHNIEKKKIVIIIFFFSWLIFFTNYTFLSFQVIFINFLRWPLLPLVFVCQLPGWLATGPGRARPGQGRAEELLRASRRPAHARACPTPARRTQTRRTNWAYTYVWVYSAYVLELYLAVVDQILDEFYNYFGNKDNSQWYSNTFTWEFCGFLVSVNCEQGLRSDRCVTGKPH